MSTTTLHYFSGEATHEDSRDGLNEYIIMSEDIPSDIKEEAMEDMSDEAIVEIMSREEMDSLNKSLDENRDFHAVKNGYILDLTEPYIIGVN